MILSTLQFIAKNLNDYLIRTLNATENSVIVSRILEANDASNEQQKNKVLISYLYLQVDKSFTNAPLLRAGSADMHEPSKMYQLYFLVTMNYDKYLDSLNVMDIVLRFFEKNYVFDTLKAMLSSDLDKVMVMPYNIGLNEMLHSKILMTHKDLTTFVYEARVLTNQQKPILPEIKIL